MKRLLLLLLAVVPLCAHADGNPDTAFFKAAAEGGISEVDLGHLALERSVNPAVKNFGAMMIKDHTALNAKLRTLAASKNIELPKTTGFTRGATKAKLKLATGTEFDQPYITAMIADHQEDVATFRREAQSGEDPDAKAFAAAALPKLEAHLRRIEAIARSSGVSALLLRDPNAWRPT